MRKSQADASLGELEVGDSLLARLRALEDKELADGSPDVELLDRQIESAQAAVEQTVVRAPSDGRILAVLAHEGQVSAGTILYMGDLSAIVGKAEVDQADIANIRVGDPADVMVRGKAISGKVTHVSGMVVPNQMKDIDPRARQDLRVVPVTILLDEAAEASRYVNMQVEATIRPRPEGAK
jgi:HlyD family secretion protein